jgi:hypothetical protein
MKRGLASLVGAWTASLLWACGSSPAAPSIEGALDGASSDAGAPGPDAPPSGDAGSDAADATIGTSHDADAAPPSDAASLLRPLAPVDGSPHWPTALAAANGHVYVVAAVAPDGGLTDLPVQVARLDPDGSWTTLVVSDRYLWGVAADVSGVYYADDEGLFRVAPDGGAPTPLMSVQQIPGPMFADDGAVYFATYDYESELYRVPTNGAPPVGLATDLAQPDSLAPAIGGVYVTEGGRLRFASLDGGPPALLAESVQGVASYGGIAYVGDIAYRGILRVAPDGGVTAFAAGASIRGHTVDATGVYFHDDDGLWRAPLDGSDVVKIAPPLPPDAYLHPMATDDARIYVAAEWVYAADKADPR